MSLSGNELLFVGLPLPPAAVTHPLGDVGSKLIRILMAKKRRTTAEGQSAVAIILPHGDEATSLPPFASRPSSAIEPPHEILSAAQHDDQGEG